MSLYVKYYTPRMGDSSPYKYYTPRTGDLSLYVKYYTPRMGDSDFRNVAYLVVGIAADISDMNFHGHGLVICYTEVPYGDMEASPMLRLMFLTDDNLVISTLQETTKVVISTLQ